MSSSTKNKSKLENALVTCVGGGENQTTRKKNPDVMHFRSQKTNKGLSGQKNYTWKQDSEKWHRHTKKLGMKR